MMSDAEPAPSELTELQLARLAKYAVAQTLQSGDIVFSPGDADYDLIVIASGRIEIVTPALGAEPEAVVAQYGPHGFLGELNFLTGQTAYLLARATEATQVYRITRRRFRDLMANDPELSDIMLRTFLARRDLLR
jgi:thioredoxin reductase (NADPH)